MRRAQGPIRGCSSWESIVYSPELLGLRDVLFGKKLSEPKSDRLFALATAAVTLDTELGLKQVGAGAITFKPQSSGEFRSTFDEVDQLVEAVAQQFGSLLLAAIFRFDGYERPVYSSTASSGAPGGRSSAWAIRSATTRRSSS
jgi:hypothetical protein